MREGEALLRPVEVSYIHVPSFAVIVVPLNNMLLSNRHCSEESGVVRVRLARDSFQSGITERPLTAANRGLVYVLGVKGIKMDDSNTK